MLSPGNDCRLHLIFIVPLENFSKTSIHQLNGICERLCVQYSATRIISTLFLRSIFCCNKNHFNTNCAFNILQQESFQHFFLRSIFCIKNHFNTNFAFNTLQKMSFQHYFLRSTFGDIALDNSHCLSRVLTYFLDFWTIFWNFWNFVGESQKVLTGALLELTVRDHPFSTYEGGEEEGFIKMRTKVCEGSPGSVRYVRTSKFPKE